MGRAGRRSNVIGCLRVANSVQRVHATAVPYLGRFLRRSDRAFLRLIARTRLPAIGIRAGYNTVVPCCAPLRPDRARSSVTSWPYSEVNTPLVAGGRNSRLQRVFHRSRNRDDECGCQPKLCYQHAQFPKSDLRICHERPPHRLLGHMPRAVNVIPNRVPILFGCVSETARL
jgi:hypothetical protein